jgi:hypothetical protein
VGAAEVALAASHIAHLSALRPRQEYERRTPAGPSAWRAGVATTKVGHAKVDVSCRIALETGSWREGSRM